MTTSFKDPLQGGAIALPLPQPRRATHVERLGGAAVAGVFIFGFTALAYLLPPFDIGGVRLDSVLAGLIAVAMIIIGSSMRGTRGGGSPPPQPDLPNVLIAMGIALVMVSIVVIIIRGILLADMQLLWHFLAGIAATVYCVVVWQCKPEKHPDLFSKFEHWGTMVLIAVGMVQAYKYI